MALGDRLTDRGAQAEHAAELQGDVAADDLGRGGTGQREREDFPGATQWRVAFSYPPEQEGRHLERAGRIDETWNSLASPPLADRLGAAAGGQAS